MNIGSLEYRIAGRELISKKTFRLPDSSHGDKLIGFRMLKRTLASLKGEKNAIDDPYEILIIDSNSEFIPLRRDYLVWAKKYNEENMLSITRDISFAYCLGNIVKLYVVLLFLIIMPFTVFSKRRVQWALIISEFIEISGFLNAAVNSKVKKVHYFSPAEKDANLAYIILNRFKLQVTKHPSPGALVSHNKYLMTDTLALSSNYQKQEYQLKLNETIVAKNVEELPPETAHKYADLYCGDVSKQKIEFKFGFYSHGGWIRKKGGSTSGLFAKPEQEELCLNLIGKMIEKFPKEKLIVFLHPKEKVQIEETKIYYSKWFSQDQLEFYTDKLPSSFCFNKAEIGIGSYSTVLFERDYFGFKSIILREEEREFPLIGTGFYKYSFNSVSELLDKVKLLTCKNN